MVDGAKDRPSVRADGEPIAARIEGVIVRLAVTHSDQRGDLCEIYNPAWGVIDAPLVYAYMTTVRPDCVKGWVYHVEQIDRLFVASGFLKIVLFDDRETSRTYRQIDEIFLSERSRGLVVIPPRVVHAVQNIGEGEAMFVNLPSRPYRHDDPDKYRVSTAQVPYDFDAGRRK